MDRLLAEKLWIVPWSILALGALVVMAIYLVLDTSHGATGVTWFILRWFHSACWLFLAIAALAMAKFTPLPIGWAKPLAITGGLFYAVFLITSLMSGTLAS